jgi:hypothetical protein
MRTIPGKKKKWNRTRILFYYWIPYIMELKKSRDKWTNQGKPSFDLLLFIPPVVFIVPLYYLVPCILRCALCSILRILTLKYVKILLTLCMLTPSMYAPLITSVFNFLWYDDLHHDLCRTILVNLSLYMIIPSMCDPPPDTSMIIPLVAWWLASYHHDS